jgi:hypothetical protein
MRGGGAPPPLDDLATLAVEDDQRHRIGGEVDDAEYVAYLGDDPVLVARRELHQ